MAQPRRDPPPLASTLTGGFWLLLGHIALQGLVAGMSLQTDTVPRLWKSRWH